MKVILLQDVQNIGKAGEVKSVSDGYGRNYLIPRGLAIEANSSELAKLENEKRKREERENRVRKASEELLRKLQKQHFLLRVKTGASGKLFGAVTSSDIAAHIRETLSIDLDKRNIELDENIKQTGEYKVDVKFPGNVKGQIAVRVDSLEES